MTGVVICFWALVVITVFAFLLAVQMRALTGMVLRRALFAEFGQRDEKERRNAVALAATGEGDDPEAAYLMNTYPRPLSHIQRARRTCLLAPPALVLLIVIGRFVLGVI